MKRVTYIVSDIDKALAFEWIAEGLDRRKFDLRFVLLNIGDSALEHFLKNRGVPVKRVKLRAGKGLVFTFLGLWWELIRSRPHVVHTHLRHGSLLGIPAAKLAGIGRRIHTRHHSTYNHFHHPHAVKTDKWISRLSTHIVSISEVVSRTLIQREGADPSKIVKIHHGFDLDYFRRVDDERIGALREKYIPEMEGPVVGAISRYLELKGHVFIIEGFKKVLEKLPGSHLVLANAVGPYEKEVRRALACLPEGSYTEIGFEADVAALYRLFDVFVHVPIADHLEAFGQTYVEALACGVPSVFTLSGVAREFIRDGENALVVDYEDGPGIGAAIMRLMESAELREKLINRGREDVKVFGLEPFIARLETLYENG